MAKVRNVDPSMCKEYQTLIPFKDILKGLYFIVNGWSLVYVRHELNQLEREVVDTMEKL